MNLPVHASDVQVVPCVLWSCFQPASIMSYGSMPLVQPSVGAGAIATRSASPTVPLTAAPADSERVEAGGGLSLVYIAAAGSGGLFVLGVVVCVLFVRYRRRRTMSQTKVIACLFQGGWNSLSVSNLLMRLACARLRRRFTALKLCVCM